jgi:hypothetical protein
MYLGFKLCITVITLSDNVTDVVMSSLKTCNMNCGSRWEGRGRVESKEWAVDHQQGTSVDARSHNDHQKGDFQVSKRGRYYTRKLGKEGSKRKDWIAGQYS